MATTEADVVDRISSVMATLAFKQAVWTDFSKTASTEDDLAFTVQFTKQSPIGQIGYYEEVQAVLEIQWLRRVNGDFETARRNALTDARSIVAGVVRDGTSGQYAVDDGGQSFGYEFPRDASYCRSTLRVPVNFEAAL
jgi:hypothetical protein